MPKLFTYPGSGNCYKCELTAAQSGADLEIVPVDILKDESHTEDFLKRNPNGKVPVLELDDGRCLAESNAIMLWLARGSDLVPADDFDTAKMLEWLFFEQYSHEPYIAVARFWWSIAPDGREEKADRFEEWREKGYRALDVMEQHLADRPFFVGERYSLADIALYAYTHVADEGGFDLDPYAALQDWMARVREQDGHIPMPPLAEAA